jgi:hypothetical protein
LNIVVGIHTGTSAGIIVVVCAVAVDCAGAGTIAVAGSIAVGINQAGTVAGTVGIY